MPFENPYKAKILAFQDFVYTDEQSQQLRGQWRSQVFSNAHPLKVEIGSGYGDFLMDYGSVTNHCNFVGMDFRVKRSFFVAKKLEEFKEKTQPEFDFRFLALDAAKIEQYFAPEEISEVFYFFPDPWPKKRHHRRRLFQKNFLHQIHPLLTPGARFWVKTDDDAYFEWMQEELAQCTELFELHFETKNLYSAEECDSSCEMTQHAREFLCQFPTKFEKMFLAQQKTIKAMAFNKK